ncbi:MAG: hypothetical protein WCO84_00985 [bacterium]
MMNDYKNFFDEFGSAKGGLETFEINVIVKINAEQIDNIISLALDSGGITYWAGLNTKTDEWKEKPKGIYYSSYATYLLLTGQAVTFYDEEGEIDEEEEWALTLPKLLDGIRLNYNNRPFDCDLENMDVETADCIIQYALFGEIVFS